MSKPQFSANDTKSKIDSDEWYTPWHIIDRVQIFYNEMYWCDVCSTKELNESIKASAYITKQENALSPLTTWHHQGIWMNPPYSRGLIGKFVDRFIEECTNNHSIEHAIILVNSSTETKWFQQLATNADIRIDIKGRLEFWHPQKENKNPISGSTLFYFGVSTRRFINLFGHLGLRYGKPLEALIM
jgi:phage N-6-adenine-methyltransferase